MEADEDDDELGQFMEVVTMYRCKFCVFTATGAKEMAQHVKSIHVRKTPYTGNTTGVTNVTQTTQPLVSIIKPSPQKPQSQNILLQTCEAPVLPAVNSYGQTGTLVSIAPTVSYEQNGFSSSSNCSSQSLYSTMPGMNLPLSTSCSSVQNVIITLSNDNEQALIEQSQPNLVPEDTDSNQQVGDYQFICQNSDGQYVLQNTENVQIGNSGTVQVLVQDSSTEPRVTTDALTETMGEHYVVAGSLNEVPTSEAAIGQENIADNDLGEIKQTENSDDVITKELYLCGNCSEGFASIQACKDHMTNVHEVTDFQTSCRVDAGTQVEPKKKPGRKKKSEIVERVKTEPEEIVMSESDEDWAEQLMSYSTRSRRKRKPPQALKNDYYLGRTKRKEQKKREPKELNVKCEMEGCSIRFKDEETMKEHLQYHIAGAGAAEPQFKCIECEEMHDHWRTTRLHMWKVHKIDIDMISCPECEFYKTDAPSKLKIHLETHGTERAYPCPICGKTFKQFAQMKNHETCHLSQEVVNSREMSDRWHTPKTCNICGRKFVNIKCMKKHKEVVHGGRKDFKCTFCSYECSRKAMLVLHLRIHNGQKPFKCDLCSYCCGDHNSLRRHKMRHTGQKPYRCPHCPYASIQAISLKVHLKNKHPGMGGIYCCDFCLYKTINKQQFDYHQMDHKNGLIKTETSVKEVKLDLSGYPHAKKPGTVILGSNLPTVYTSMPIGSQSILQALQAHVSQNSSVQEVQQSHSQNSNVQEVIESSGTQHALHTQSLILDEGQVSQLQLQMNENGENVVVENFPNESIAPNDVAAAQLIYSALTAIAQNPNNGKEEIDSQGLVAGVERGEIQTSIETNLKEGVTTHTITFHLPEGEEITREVTLQDQNEPKDAISVIELAGVNEWQETETIAELQQES